MWAMALQRLPAANAVWAEDRILRFEHSDIGIAVAIDGGLITPVIRQAERKSLTAISAEMKELAARARDKKLKPNEYQGGASAISNLGMYGVREFSAIINPPQATILAVGAARRQAVEKDDGSVGWRARRRAAGGVPGIRRAPGHCTGVAMNRRFAISVVVMFVLLFVLGWLVHGGLLRADYERIRPLLRSPDETRANILYVFVAVLATIPINLLQYAVMPFPLDFMLKRMCYDVATIVLMSVVLAFIYRGDRARQG
jgi:hypothetical protein